MLSKRIIPCLDVREGRTTKGIKFKNNVDIGDPVEMAQIYYEAGADEIVFYDITASHEKRNLMIEVVTGIGTVKSMARSRSNARPSQTVTVAATNRGLR